MQRMVQLGRSGVRISPVVFGSMSLGAAGGDTARREQTLRAAVDAGITSVDTAPIYDFGLCEQWIGDALHREGSALRDRVQVLTKVGLRWDAEAKGDVHFRAPDGQGGERVVRRDSRPAAVRRDVEESLRRLRVDVLDVVQVHQPDAQTPIAETMAALAALHREGKLRAIGVSNYSAAQMREAHAALASESLPLASNQVHYSLVERYAEREILPLARELGISVLAYSPLEAGLLKAAPSRSNLPRNDPRLDDARFHPANVQRVALAMERGVVPVARGRGVAPSQVAMAYLLAQPALDGVVVGASTPEQARANAGCATIELSEEELRTIARAFAGVSIDHDAGHGRLWRLQRRVTRLPSRAKHKLQRVLSLLKA